MSSPEESDIKNMETFSVDWRYGQLNVFSEDNTITNSMVLYGEWAQNEIDFLASLCEHYEHPEIIIGGANIGIQTIALSKILGRKTGKIHAFEIHPQIFEILQKNIEINLCENVILYNKGLSDEQEEIEIPLMNTGEIQNIGAFSLHRNVGKRETTRAHLQTIDSLSMSNCSLIHLDVEKHELSCLKGALETIEKYNPDIYAEVLNYGHAISIYKLLKPYYENIYIHAPLAYNSDNFNKDATRIFGNSREFAIYCSNRTARHQYLYQASSEMTIQKIFDTLAPNNKVNKLDTGKSPRKQHLFPQANLQIYIDSGNGFSEQDSVFHFINSKFCSLNIDITEYKRIDSIRIDPHNDKCIVKIHNISINNQETEEQQLISNIVNSYLDIDSYFFFDTDDPQIIITEINLPKDYQILNIEIEYFELDNSLLKILYHKIYHDNKLLKYKLDHLMDEKNMNYKDSIDKVDLNLQNVKEEVIIIKEQHQDNVVTLENRINSLEQALHVIQKATSSSMVDVVEYRENINQFKSILDQHIVNSNELLNSILTKQIDIESYQKRNLWQKIKNSFGSE